MVFNPKEFIGGWGGRSDDAAAKPQDSSTELLARPAPTVAAGKAPSEKERSIQAHREACAHLVAFRHAIGGVPENKRHGELSAIANAFDKAKPEIDSFIQRLEARSKQEI
jgi:hypothetical protein